MTSELPDGIAVDPVLVIGATRVPDESAAREIAVSDVDRWGVSADLSISPFGRVWRNAEVGVA